MWVRRRSNPLSQQLGAGSRESRRLRNPFTALKVLPPGLLADEAARKRFRNEALALAKLNHPCIEAIHDFGSEAGWIFW